MEKDGFNCQMISSPFTGKWRPEKGDKWTSWTGKRVKNTPNRNWLIILEANWETSLNEKEYSWGDTLKSYFKRFKNVEVRHRFFTGKKSIQKWIREINFIPGPVYLMISTHGTEEGVSVNF